MSAPTPENIERAVRALYEEPKLVVFTGLVPPLAPEDVEAFWTWFNGSAVAAAAFDLCVSSVSSLAWVLRGGLTAEVHAELLMANYFKGMLFFFLHKERPDALLRYLDVREDVGVKMARAIKEPATQRE
jgi:hypothetical protein